MNYEKGRYAGGDENCEGCGDEGDDYSGGCGGYGFGGGVCDGYAGLDEDEDAEEDGDIGGGEGHTARYGMVGGYGT